MRRIVQYLAKKPIVPAIVKSCEIHNAKAFPHIKADEYCKSCNQEMCYLCSNKHIEAGHLVSISQRCFHDTQAQQNTLPNQIDSVDIKGEQILNALNHGQLISFKWDQCKCPCGAEINQSDKGAICVACGTATCSIECHHEYVEQKNQCRFHENFNLKSNDKSMRSILMKNVTMLFDQGLGRGSPVNKTSQHFIMGFLSSTRESIYLQRGYRQYGNPLQTTLSSMSLLEKYAALDTEINLFRLCKCKCSSCSERGLHPVINCQHRCKTDFMMRLRDANQDPVVHVQCTCECEFCSSGITCFSHQRIDCIQRCIRSPLYVKQ